MMVIFLIYLKRQETYTTKKHFCINIFFGFVSYRRQNEIPWAEVRHTVVGVIHVGVVRNAEVVRGPVVVRRTVAERAARTAAGAGNDLDLKIFN